MRPLELHLYSIITRSATVVKLPIALRGRILSRYLFFEVLGTFGICLMVFTGTTLSSQVFKVTDLVINKGFGLGETFRFVLFLVPTLLMIVTPMSLLLAILVTLGRMSADNEVIAFKASGVSLTQMLKPILLVSAVGYLLTSLFSLYLAPSASYSLRKMVFDVARTKAEVGIKERIFNTDFEGLMIYVDRAPEQGKRLEGILLSDTRQSAEPATIIAQSGYLIPNPETLELTLHLEHGSIHRLTAKSNTYQKIDFSVYELVLDVQKAMPEASGKGKKPKEMSTAELWGAIAQSGEGEKRNDSLVELTNRFATPFACLVFALLGLPLGIHSPRAGRSFGFVLSLLVILLYYVFFTLGENLGRLGRVHPVVAGWMPNAVFFLVSYYLFRKVHTESPVLVIERMARVAELVHQRVRRLKGEVLPDDAAVASVLHTLNCAGVEELATRLSIGSREARILVKYRERVGGIKDLEEVKTIRGLGDTVYAEIIKQTLA